jgi:hypothetical protein
VLQLKEIPQRPEEYDGMLCLFGVDNEIDGVAIREALAHFGKVESCELDGPLRQRGAHN